MTRASKDWEPPPDMVVRSRPVAPGLAADPDEDNHALAFTLTAAGVEGWVREHEYAEGRKLRADFAWPEERLLVEVVGGIYTGQAHGSVSGILKDIDRLNEATLNGWRLLRVTPKMIKTGEALELVEKALAR